MSTVRIPLTRLSSVAKRERNAAAASRIAAGRSPRGHVALASSNSWKGLSPIFSGLSITAMGAPLGCSLVQVDCSRPPALPPPPHLLAAAHAVAAIDDGPVATPAAAHHVAAASASLDPVPARAAEQPVAAALPPQAVGAALSLDAVVAAARAHAVVARPRVDPLPAVGGPEAVAPSRSPQLDRAGLAPAGAAASQRQRHRRCLAGGE